MVGISVNEQRAYKGGRLVGGPGQRTLNAGEVFKFFQRNKLKITIFRKNLSILIIFNENLAIFSQIFRIFPRIFLENMAKNLEKLRSMHL